MAADWRLLDTVPIHERQRLHRVVAALSTADPAANRKRRKIARANRVRQEEAVLNQTGIRARRRRSVVTTPNVFPPPVDQARAADAAAASVDRVCYVCKEPYSQVHAFYDQLCPDCATVNSWPATVKVPARGSLVGLAVMEYRTVAFPVPAPAKAIMLIQSFVLSTVHEQMFAAVTATVPV